MCETGEGEGMEWWSDVLGVEQCKFNSILVMVCGNLLMKFSLHRVSWLLRERRERVIGWIMLEEGDPTAFIDRRRSPRYNLLGKFS